ncbi:MAG: metal ABC transporter ATP-binding protein [Acetobacteraceae bacterium]
MEFRDVTLALGGRTVLESVSITIGEQEFVGVLGPNGAGKTTALRAILGLVPPRHGRIHVLGQPAGAGNPTIGYLPQAMSQVAGMRLRGRDFVATAYRGHHLGLPLVGTAGAREVASALELVGAEALALRPLAELSGGERQRLLLAQALLGRPRLLLLDEPLISLDPHHQAAVVALTRSLQKALGITVLFTAHEINPLLGVIDRVLYLGQRQAALGTVAEVITGPVLSRLYGMTIEVMNVHGRIFVMSDGNDMERGAHRHEDVHQRA